MMKLLITFGGNPNAMDTEKWTPLVKGLFTYFINLHSQRDQGPI
jgi:hypothetical protein